MTRRKFPQGQAVQDVESRMLPERRNGSRRNERLRLRIIAPRLWHAVRTMRAAKARLGGVSSWLIAAAIVLLCDVLLTMML